MAKVAREAVAEGEGDATAVAASSLVTDEPAAAAATEGPEAVEAGGAAAAAAIEGNEAEGEGEEAEDVEAATTLRDSVRESPMLRTGWMHKRGEVRRQPRAPAPRCLPPVRGYLATPSRPAPVGLLDSHLASPP